MMLSWRLGFGAIAAFCFAILMASCAGDDPAGADCGGCSSGNLCCEVAGVGPMCRDTQTDSTHCGGCGIRCAAGQTCSGGTCQGSVPADGSVGLDSGPSMCGSACTSSQRCCGSSCVDRQVTSGTDGRANSSFRNCNGCGNACNMDRASACSVPLGMGGTPRCLCGNSPECAAGFVCAAGAGGAFTCINTQTDRNNCGRVGNVCPGAETCSGGVCGCGSITCGAGTSCCGGACIPTDSDPNNCGGCDIVCGAQGTSCEGGMCKCGSGPACRKTMGTDKGQICCANSCVDNNDSHCGACDNACEGGMMNTCIVGSSFFPGGSGEGVCCGFGGLPIPGFEGFCLDFPGLGGGDGGLPFPGGDGGLPFP